MSDDLKAKVEALARAMSTDDEAAAKALFVELGVRVLTDLSSIATSLQKIAARSDFTLTPTHGSEITIVFEDKAKRRAS